jgi:hypothetical protein
VKLTNLYFVHFGALDGVIVFIYPGLQPGLVYRALSALGIGERKQAQLEY